VGKGEMAVRIGTTTPAEVTEAFARFPEPVRRRLLEVRQLIFATATETAGVGPLTETLKWGEPAYLTETTGSGSTIRLGWSKKSKDECSVLFNCQTTLVATFRDQFGDVFRFAGNRALLLDTTGPLPRVPLAVCLSAALTYHQRRQRK
jgi:hypothetical protein